MRTRRRFTREFNDQAVRLVRERALDDCTDVVNA
jgi:hypothetical protein